MGYFDDEENQKKINDAVKKSLSVFEPGVYVLKFQEVKKIVSKKGGLFLKVVFGDKNHKPVEHMFGWAGKYKDEELKKLGQWANHISKGQTLRVGQVLNDEDEVAEVEKWLEQYIGNDVRVAVKLEEQLFSKEEDGEFTLIKFNKNRIYMLTAVERSLVITDLSKLKKKLSTEDQAKYKAYIEKKEADRKAKEDKEDNDIPEESSPADDKDQDFDVF